MMDARVVKILQEVASCKRERGHCPFCWSYIRDGRSSHDSECSVLLARELLSEETDMGVKYFVSKCVPQVFVYCRADTGEYGWVRLGEQFMPPDNPPSRIYQPYLQEIGDISSVGKHELGYTVWGV